MAPGLMLAVHCKKSEPLDLKEPIKDYIARTYGPQAAREVADDLEAVQSMRSDLMNATGTLPSTRHALAKYYRVLTAMETRFPISRGGDHISLCFVWYDAFRNTKKSEQYNIHFEKAATVFNLGAIQSQVALGADRKTEEGLKESAKYFQEAAGTFAYLRDVACLKVEPPRPADLSPECATMLEKLMLAQAQECVLETAVIGRKSPAILARLAKQCAAYYDDCSRILFNPPLNQHFDRSWLAHATVKSMLYEAESLIQSGAAFTSSDDIDGVAKEIARLRSVLNLLANCKREAKNASKELQDTAQAKEDAVTLRLAKAEKENATVYLQRVPAESDLPGVAPASLVKPLTPDNLRPQPEEGKMFASVVPESSFKNLSKYTDMVDTLIREQMDKLGAASDDARLRLREWELPECLQVLDSKTTAALPDAVRVELESVQDAGGAAHLQDLVGEIRALRQAAADELSQCEVELDAEAKEDEGLRNHYGARWNRTPSAQLTRVMRDKVAGYRSNLAAAGESDGRLEQKLAAESAAFAALDPEAAAAQMPRLQAPMLSVDNMEPATIVATLRQALESLSTLSSQRAALEEALKEQKNKDDILPKLMGGAEASDATFKEELKKYDELVKEVDANVAAQAQVLDVIAKNQAAYRSAYGYNEWRKSCETAAQDVRKQVQAYVELRDNLSEGLRFYTSLQEAIGTLRQQVGDHCMTRKIQRDDVIDDLRRQADDQAKQAEERAAQQLAAMKLAESQAQAQAAQAQAAAAAAAAAAVAPPAAAAAAAAQPHPPPSSGGGYPQGPGGYGAPPQQPQAQPCGHGGHQPPQQQQSAAPQPPHPQHQPQHQQQPQAYQQPAYYQPYQSPAYGGPPPPGPGYQPQPQQQPQAYQQPGYYQPQGAYQPAPGYPPPQYGGYPYGAPQGAPQPGPPPPPPTYGAHGYGSVPPQGDWSQYRPPQ